MDIASIVFQQHEYSKYIYLQVIKVSPHSRIYASAGHELVLLVRLPAAHTILFGIPTVKALRPKFLSQPLRIVRNDHASAV